MGQRPEENQVSSTSGRARPGRPVSSDRRSSRRRQGSRPAHRCRVGGSATLGDTAWFKRVACLAKTRSRIALQRRSRNLAGAMVAVQSPLQQRLRVQAGAPISTHVERAIGPRSSGNPVACPGRNPRTRPGSGGPTHSWREIVQGLDVLEPVEIDLAVLFRHDRAVRPSRTAFERTGPTIFFAVSDGTTGRSASARSRPWSGPP